MSGSPPLFSDYLYFYSFMDRNVHAHFYRQPISIDCQVLFIFFFSGRLCRNRYCTFLDFQNRFDKVCRIVFRFVRRPFSRILRDRKRHILLEVRTGNIAGLSACPQGRNTPPSVCHISSVSVPAPHGFPSLAREGLCPRNSIFSLKK